MSRVIKFRAWDGEDARMYEDVCFYPNASYDQLNLMQFTRLKDKNGVDIYEGDIWNDSHFTYLVKYDEEFAGFTPFVTDGGCGCCSGGEVGYKPSHGEIIGNIHENPELLGNQQ